MRWTDALEIQAKMRALCALPEAQIPCESALKYGTVAHQSPSTQAVGWRVVAQSLSEIFRRAQPFWVQRDMLQLATAAADTMPNQPVILTDLPCADGTLFFEDLILMPTPGSHVKFRGIVWHAEPKGVHVIPFCEDEGPKVVPIGSRNLGWPLYPFDVSFWAWDEDPFIVRPDDRSERNSAWALYRLPLALWILMGQRLTVTDTVDPERASRRRMPKGPKLVADKIKIVHLRKIDYARSDNEVHVAWSHRWLVNGHWKNQWFPSLQTHRLIWVAAHIKGPQSKPIVLKDTVNLLVR